MSQSTRPTLDDDVEVFLAGFRDADDLADLSFAARRILACSAALFYRAGAAATSIRDITTACGLSPGALYNHFASKDDLLDTVVRHGHQAMDDRLSRALAAAPAKDPVGRTNAFVGAYVTGHLEHPQLAQVVRREYMHLSESRYLATVTARRRTRDRLAALLRNGRAAGSFTLGGESPTVIALMVLDMCSRVSEWYDPRRPRADAIDTVTDRYVRAALRLAGA